MRAYTELMAVEEWKECETHLEGRKQGVCVSLYVRERERETQTHISHNGKER